MGAFKVISANSHIVEPSDMYTSRIEPRFASARPLGHAGLLACHCYSLT
jgi:hypothetical protein